ncbi:response regulator [Peptoniphilus sp. MSJ-1]|uniref:Response regulator n=1 Tax=Peptoniphilus ovalis TaxID=2841503 RepID=A0ABS6FJU0_9FIRM|nr:helix-turn-helix domain-containing protein [Peptoniphilus ovalis]MBU5669767.1 response regulator [Peptoniphilus ovalis]
MYNVLLVSNQNLIRTAIKKTIEKNSKFNVVAEADTPKEAFSVIDRGDVNIVFSDYIMPNMSGLDFINKIEKEYNDIKVFLLAFPTELFSRENRSINLNHIILKPITYDKVNEKLKIFEKSLGKNNESDYGSEFILEMQKSINLDNFLEVYKYFADYVERFNFKDKNLEYKNHLNLELRGIAEKIIYLNNFIEDVKILDTKLELNNLIISDIKLCQNWIFKVVEYYFKRKSITKYPILKDVLSYIDNNIDKNISLSDVVKGCNISQGYLSRLFKSEYSMTVVNFIHLKKVNFAKELILVKNQSVSDVAFNLGYNESGYFSKIFKKYEKVTVEQFRKTR